MMNPGHIIPEGKVIGKDSHKRGWIVKLQGINEIALLKWQYIPAGVTINYGSDIRNLVVIGRSSKLFHVALEGYMDVLFKYYYNCGLVRNCVDS